MAKFIWNEEEFLINTKNASKKALKRMSGFLVGDIKRSMLPGSYRQWRSNKRDGSLHWSSSPGKPPAPDTKELHDSISYAMSDGTESGVDSNSRVENVGTPTSSSNEVSSVIGTQDIKGLWMEKGVDKRNIAPRPFLRTAIPRNKDILKRIFENTVKRSKI